MPQGLKMLREMKSVVISTIDGDQAHSRIIDIMHVDIEGLYFITLKSKPFYRQLSKNPKLAVTGMNKDYVQVRLVGQAKPLTLQKIHDLIEQNPGMIDLFPEIKNVEGDDSNIWQVFHIHRGKGEIFDLSGREVKMKRERFTFGGEAVNKAGQTIKSNCIECGKCRINCPFNAISKGSPYTINPTYCDECGICYSVCPVDAVKLSKGL